MSSQSISLPYRCVDDCRYEGCPGHTLNMRYRNSSDTFSYWVDDKEGQRVYIDGNALMTLVKGALITMPPSDVEKLLKPILDEAHNEVFPALGDETFSRESVRGIIDRSLRALRGA